MKYEELLQFIRRRMRMSHIYQPVMLMELLGNGGKSSESEIARSILSHDESQLEYYENVVRNMVGRVLRRHGIVERIGRDYVLADFGSFSADEINQLITACNEKLSEYLEIRGQEIWNHRKQSSGYIPGTLRFEVLKAAQRHCELCGISGDLKRLDVDHIIPRNKGGTDDLFNLQALCYSCNAMKRDRDDTDFRKIRESYYHRESNCIFCEIPKSRIIQENELAIAILDAFPVTPFHTLVIPKRHIKTYFELSRPELNACHSLLSQSKQFIEQKDSGVSGFNIGMNCDESAGQTVFHCHIHLIPRRIDDVKTPKGGVRNILPGKANY